MLRRRAEDSLFPYCLEKEIGVITYSPLESGVLTDSLSRQRVRRLRADDWRKTRSPYFREPELSAVLELVETLKRIACGGGRSVCGLAVAWVLRRPEVTAAIVGARRPGQILKTACAAENPLSDSESVAVERALSGYRECLRRGKRSDG
jgi:aryl-alcohol dehydrogenase-like predicted oxidoreductase